MGLFEYIDTHHAEFWIAVGVALLALELLLFGLSTMILLFAGIAGVLTGVLMLIGVLPESWVAGFASFGIIGGIAGIVLWKPLQNLQQAERPVSGHSSDLLGLEFVLSSDIDNAKTAQHDYSGVTWKIELDRSAEDEHIAAGTRVRVVSVDAGIFRVVPSS